jgi:ADP-ribose pyrophosphatase
VDVCAIIKTPGKPDQVILELQYRPAMDTPSLEFPSGLVDAGEKPEEAAIRELKEETGYVGKVTHVSPVIVRTNTM